MRIIKIITVFIIAIAVGAYFPVIYGDTTLTGIIVKNSQRYFQRLKSMRAITPDNSELSYQIANYYYSLKMEDEAIKEYKRTLSLDPDNFNAKWFLSKLYVSKRYYDKAFWLLRDLIEVKSDNPDLYMAAGDILVKMGKERTAKQYYAKYDELVYNETDGGKPMKLNTVTNRSKWLRYFY